MRRKCRGCLCRTCINICGKCADCKGKIESCNNYNGFFQMKIFDTQSYQSNSAPRHSWEHYGISKERYRKLTEYIRSGKYTSLALYSAHTANEIIAEYIFLSIMENKSYDALKAKWELREMEQIPYCRTDFYGIRRYAMHLFDLEMKKIKK